MASALIRVSPNHFQRKLNLACRCLCGGDQSRAWDGIPGLSEDSEVIGRRGKIRSIKEVEKLRPELDIRVF